MDSSAFNRMDLSGIWWLFLWAGIGILASAAGVIWLILHLIHHIRWV